MGIQTLKEGHRRVVDRNTIDIWDDDCIPSNPSCTTRGHNLIAKVSDLIDPMTNQWGEELIDQTFWHVDR